MDLQHSFVDPSAPATITTTSDPTSTTPPPTPPIALPHHPKLSTLTPAERLAHERSIDAAISEGTNDTEDPHPPASNTMTEDTTPPAPEYTIAAETLTLAEFEAELTAKKASRALEREGRFTPSTGHDVLRHKTPASAAKGPSGGRAAVVSRVAALDDSAEVAPVALGRPRTSESTQRLYVTATKEQLMQPEFEFVYHGVSGAGHFSGKLVLGFRGGDGVLFLKEVVDEGPHKTKKEAKEALAEAGLAVVEQTLEEIKLGRAAEDIVVGGGERAPAAPTEKESTDGEVTSGRVVGLLLEYALAYSVAQPVFQIYSIGLQSFACEVTVTIPSADPPTASPGAPSADTDTGKQQTLNFGSQTRAYAQKKLARSAAAAAAIAHLRSINLLDGSGLAPKKNKMKKKGPDGVVTPLSAQQKKPSSQTATPTNGRPSAATPAISSLALPTDAIPNAPAEAPLSPSTLRAIAAPFDENTPPTSQLTVLCARLGLGNVTYRLTAAPGTALYSGAGYFEQGSKHGFGAVLEGPLGGVKGVFGRQNAKEEVARLVVEVLRGEAERRGGGGDVAA